MARVILTGILLSVIASCADAPVVEVPPDFPAIPVPADNALTFERISLGKRLFYDDQLSRSREVSCASCHVPDHGFADPRAKSVGVDGQLGERNAPTLVNIAYSTSYFWDGGAPTLEQQVIGPITNPLEMDMKLGDVIDRVAADPTYVEAFDAAYGEAPSPGTLTRALASFLRSIVSADSPFDRFQRGDSDALTESEKRGLEIASGERGECFHCHVGFNLTNNGFRNNNLYAVYEDIGRARITELPSDIGKFRVPTLRNVALTAPYMHDGSLATLDEVVAHYNSGGFVSATSDPTIQPLELTAQERADLVAWLGSLTDPSVATNPRFLPDEQ